MPASGISIRTFDGHVNGVSCIAISLDGKIIISGSLEKLIVHNVDDGTIFREIEAHADNINSVAFNKDGSLLASGSDDCVCKVWKVGDWSV